MAVTRRAILAGGVAAGAALTGEPTRRDGDSALRQELERFLHLVAGSRADSAGLRAALEASAAALGEDHRQRLEQQAIDHNVSPHDFLAYALMDGLPLPRALLAHYLPRGVAFAVPRQEGQGAMLGAAFLPTTAPLHWRQAEGYSGLSGGSRPGLHLGVNQGLAMVSLCGPSAERQSPGVPAPLAAEFVLQTARSPEAALAVLEELAAPRPGLHILCDTVTGVIQAVPIGGADPAAATARAFLVGGSLGPAGNENLAVLERHLQANLGWLNLEKALAVLDQALPAAVRIVLDLDGRGGRLESSQASQDLSF